MPILAILLVIALLAFMIAGLGGHLDKPIDALIRRTAR